jgi:hypothetical protein
MTTRWTAHEDRKGEAEGIIEKPWCQKLFPKVLDVSLKIPTFSKQIP